MDKLLTPAEVGAIMGIHQKTVERLCRSGELPGFRIGRYWRFRRLDFEKYVDVLAEATVTFGMPAVSAGPISIQRGGL